MKISFIQPSRNNLKYLKWSYDAIRKNLTHKEHEICVADDFSNDGTLEWCKEMAEKDPYFKYIRNNGPTRLGHTILYDRLINEVATNDIVMIYHADMYACPNFDKYIEKYIQPGTVVSLTRIEPPLHPPGPEKICIGFGQEPEEFKEQEFLKWFNETSSDRIDKITEGIFAPWAIYKKDFQSIGGHDPLYAPQSKEDSDIFNRFLLNGYKFIQTWEGCVYHMTCRGSRFNPTLTTVGKESNEWSAQNIRSARNFLRKWGHYVKHNSTMKPIVNKKFDIGFSIKNCNENILNYLEPICDTIYVDMNFDNYINQEQKNTKFDLTKKIKSIKDKKINDIIISVDGGLLNNDNVSFLLNISEILEQNHEIGLFAYDIFTVEINKLSNYENYLININNDYYQSKLNS